MSTFFSSRAPGAQHTESNTDDTGAQDRRWRWLREGGGPLAASKEQGHHRPELLPSPMTTLHTCDWALLALPCPLWPHCPLPAPWEPSHLSSCLPRSLCTCFLPSSHPSQGPSRPSDLRKLPPQAHCFPFTAQCGRAFGLVNCVWVTLTVLYKSASTCLVSLLYIMYNTIWPFYINVLLSVLVTHGFCTRSL